VDLYNRYLLRIYGEKKHQAETPAEAAVYAVLEWFKETGEWGEFWGDKTDGERSALVDALFARLQVLSLDKEESQNPNPVERALSIAIDWIHCDNEWARLWEEKTEVECRELTDTLRRRFASLDFWLVDWPVPEPVSDAYKLRCILLPILTYLSIFVGIVAFVWWGSQYL